jgi:hypothetical protein
MKFNGPKIDAIILAGHLQLNNWAAMEKVTKRRILFNRVCITLAIGLMVYTAVR